MLYKTNCPYEILEVVHVDLQPELLHRADYRPEYEEVHEDEENPSSPRNNDHLRERDEEPIATMICNAVDGKEIGHDVLECALIRDTS